MQHLLIQQVHALEEAAGAAAVSHAAQVKELELRLGTQVSSTDSIAHELRLVQVLFVTEQQEQEARVRKKQDELECALQDLHSAKAQLAAAPFMVADAAPEPEAGVQKARLELLMHDMAKTQLSLQRLSDTIDLAAPPSTFDYGGQDFCRVMRDAVGQVRSILCSSNSAPSSEAVRLISEVSAISNSVHDAIDELKKPLPPLAGISAVRVSTDNQNESGVSSTLAQLDVAFAT